MGAMLPGAELDLALMAGAVGTLLLGPGAVVGPRPADQHIVPSRRPGGGQLSGAPAGA